MATNYICDNREAALALYQVNHLQPLGIGDECFFWVNSQGLPGIPTGDDRDAAIIAAGTDLGVTVNALSPYLRERQFWFGWKALPPTPLA